MLLTFIRWLARNITTLLLAFILAVVVWVSAVVTADPNEERIYARPVNLVGLDSKLKLMGSLPSQARITLRAPRSILNQLTNNPSRVEAWIDLSGYGPGEHTIPLKADWDLNPARLSLIEPDEVTVTLEAIVSEEFPVTLTVIGDPPLGYRKGTPERNPETVAVSGPASAVAQVSEVRARLNIAGASDTVRVNIPLEAVDTNGDVVDEITIQPKEVSVSQGISLQGGYKNVVVKVVTNGQIANGYRLTNISVTPPNVTIFSANPQLVNAVPGFVETEMVDLAGLSDDIDMRVPLNLPEGVTLVGEQSVLVQVGVAAIEGSLTVSLPIEVLGLPPSLAAEISPATIDVIVAGPLPILDTLTPASFRAVVDLSGHEPGTYQLTPVVDLVPEQIQIQDILPETVEVTVHDAPTATPTTPTPGPSQISPQSAEVTRIP